MRRSSNLVVHPHSQVAVLASQMHGSEGHFGMRTAITGHDAGEGFQQQTRRRWRNSASTDASEAFNHTGRRSPPSSSTSPGAGIVGMSNNNTLSINNLSAGSTPPPKTVRIAVGGGGDGSAASSVTSAIAVKVKRKRSMIACRNCNERRVKCDGSITGLPCTTCRSAGRNDCAFIDSKRVRGKRGRFESRDKLRARPESQSPMTPTGSSQRDPPQRMALVKDPTSGATSIPESSPYSSFQSEDSNSNNLSNSYHTNPPNSPNATINLQLSTGHGRNRGPTITAKVDNNIWRRLFEGTQAGAPQTQRVTYVGESWHLSWVLHQKTGSSPLHFPSPVIEDSPETPPVPVYPTVDAGLHAINNGEDASGSGQPEGSASGRSAAYTLQTPTDKMLSVPPPLIRDALIDAYFKHFHPFFPILDKEHFTTNLNCSTTKKAPSLLLLQSVLLIGSMHCPLSLLTTPQPNHPEWIPFDKRSMAIETSVTRARALFNNDHEKDRLSVIQSMFLLQFWWRIPGDFKDQCYWLAGAIRIAQGMGLHRSTRESWAEGILSDKERMFWRRMWWALYIRDRQSASSMGKPVLIQDEDCDLEELSMEDFANEPREIGLYALECVKVVRVLAYILKCEFTPRPKMKTGAPELPASDTSLRREQCQTMLEEWNRGLPPELSWETESTCGHNRTTTSPTGMNLTRRLMQLTFQSSLQTYELLLHRPIFYKPPGGRGSSTSTNDTAANVFGAISEGSSTTSLHAPNRQLPASISSHAAKMITKHAREVDAICNGDTRFLPLSYVSFLFAAMSVQMVELTSGDAERERKIRDDVEFNTKFLGKLAEMYPIGGWCRKLIVKILTEEVPTQQSSSAKEPNQQEPQPELQPEEDPMCGREDSQMRGHVRTVFNQSMENQHAQNQHQQQAREQSLQHESHVYEQSIHHSLGGERGGEAVVGGVVDRYENSIPSPNAHSILHNPHPHYNPHHTFHNSNFYPLTSPPLPTESYASSTSTGPSGEITIPPPTSAFNHFEPPSLEAHSNRIRNMGIKYIDPSPSESEVNTPTRALSPLDMHPPIGTTINTNTTTATALAATSAVLSHNEQLEHEKRRLSHKWANDVLLDTDILRVSNCGPLDEPATEHMRQANLGGLRYHVMQERQQGICPAEELFDDQNEGDEDEEMQEEHDRERILLAAAAAARGLRGGSVHAVGSIGGIGTHAAYPHPQSTQSLPQATPPPQSHYDPPWMFDEGGMLLGNPFLVNNSEYAAGATPHQHQPQYHSNPYQHQQQQQQHRGHVQHPHHHHQ